jgi:hypothetical protein
MSLFDDLKEFVGEFGDLAKESIDTYGQIIGATEDARERPKPKIEPARIERNLSASDFAFQPNWYLVGFGVLILVIVYLGKK